MIDDPDYQRLQSRLEAGWRADLPGSTTDHVIVGLPSYSLDPLLLSHYADRIPPLEHRYLACLLLLRNPHTRLVYLSSVDPPDYVLDEYVRLLPEDVYDSLDERCLLLDVGDASARPLSLKFLERPDLLERVRDFVGDMPAMIEAWNVTELERDLALAIDVPLFGSEPELWPLATKSGCRRLFKELDVPCCDGAEDLRSLRELVGAIVDLHERRADVESVIVKLNDSASGDGNAIIDLRGVTDEADVHARLQALPGWYVQSFEAMGGVVEERIVGRRFASPSAQVTVRPDGHAIVISTHDQVLGGHAGQVYQGCRFPADPGYAAEVGRLGGIVGQRYADLGVRGRLAVDFAASQRDDGTWDLYALEVNLRKGGTTHPFSAMRSLTRAAYDVVDGVAYDPTGQLVYYAATDNYVDDGWARIDPTALQTRVREEELDFSTERGTGVLLHLLNCLPIDGRFGCTALGRTAEEADELYERVGKLAASLL